MSPTRAPKTATWPEQAREHKHEHAAHTASAGVCANCVALGCAHGVGIGLYFKALMWLRLLMLWLGVAAVRTVWCGCVQRCCDVRPSGAHSLEGGIGAARMARGAILIHHLPFCSLYYHHSKYNPLIVPPIWAAALYGCAGLQHLHDRPAQRQRCQPWRGTGEPVYAAAVADAWSFYG